MNGFFPRRAGSMFCEGAALRAVANRFGTPCHVMSAGALRTAVGELKDGFASAGLFPVICYAVKANPSLAVIQVLRDSGCGAEVVSGGELHRALCAGIAPGRIVFSGVGKTVTEMVAGLRARILMFNVESVEELRALSGLAARMGRRAPVALRVNPGVDAHTHRYITTGTPGNKFGIDFRQASRAFLEASRMPGIELLGLHTHIGSQISGLGPFVECARRVNALLDSVGRRGVFPRWRNIGGGFGVSYGQGAPRMDVGALAGALARALGTRRAGLLTEPGRFLTAEAGVLLTRVIHVKRGERKTFAVVDAAMNDLIRPCLYGSYHGIVPVFPRRGAAVRVDVVGPVCESSDFLGLDRRLPPLEPGDLLAVTGTGAYGSSMASNYNSRPRAAEVMVNGRAVRLMRRRETFADLIRGEKGAGRRG